MSGQVRVTSDERSTTPLERFVLAIPSNTLYKLSYVWFAVVILLDLAPVISAILALLLLVRVIVPKVQRRVWQAKVIRDRAGGASSPYVDRPRTPLARQGINLALVLVGSGLLAYFLDGSLTLSGVQWGLLVAGFFLFQMDARLFGNPTTYILTGEGIGIITSNVRLFLAFDEIAQAICFEDVETAPAHWAILAPTQELREGLLLVPRDRSGFTRLVDHVALAPSDQQEFVVNLPQRLVAVGNER